MTLHQITSAVRAAHGEILSMGPSPIGYVIWASIHGQSCRIVSPLVNKSAKPVPPVLGCQTHVVTDGPGLQAWLTSLHPVPTPALAPTV
ncbi:hypothetical protein [Spirosoma koreense]